MSDPPPPAPSSTPPAQDPPPRAPGRGRGAPRLPPGPEPSPPPPAASTQDAGSVASLICPDCVAGGADPPPGASFAQVAQFYDARHEALRRHVFTVHQTHDAAQQTFMRSVGDLQDAADRRLRLVRELEGRIRTLETQLASAARESATVRVDAAQIVRLTRRIADLEAEVDDAADSLARATERLSEVDDGRIRAIEERERASMEAEDLGVRISAFPSPELTRATQEYVNLLEEAVIRQERRIRLLMGRLEVSSVARADHLALIDTLDAILRRRTGSGVPASHSLARTSPISAERALDPSELPDLRPREAQHDSTLLSTREITAGGSSSAVGDGSASDPRHSLAAALQVVMHFVSNEIWSPPTAWALIRDAESRLRRRRRSDMLDSASGSLDPSAGRHLRPRTTPQQPGSGSQPPPPPLDASSGASLTPSAPASSRNNGDQADPGAAQRDVPLHQLPRSTQSLLLFGEHLPNDRSPSPPPKRPRTDTGPSDPDPGTDSDTSTHTLDLHSGSTHEPLPPDVPEPGLDIPDAGSVTPPSPPSLSGSESPISIDSGEEKESEMPPGTVLQFGMLTRAQFRIHTAGVQNPGAYDRYWAACAYIDMILRVQAPSSLENIPLNRDPLFRAIRPEDLQIFPQSQSSRAPSTLTMTLDEIRQVLDATEDAHPPPWDAIVQNMPQPRSFPQGPPYNVLRRLLRSWVSTAARIFWHRMHYIPWQHILNQLVLPQDPSAADLALVARIRALRKDLKGLWSKRKAKSGALLIEILRLMADGYLDNRFLLDPSFLILPAQEAVYPWLPDFSSNAPSLPQQLADLDDREPWRLYYTNHPHRHPARLYQYPLRGIFTRVRPAPMVMPPGYTPILDRIQILGSFAPDRVQHLRLRLPSQTAAHPPRDPEATEPDDDEDDVSDGGSSGSGHAVE